MNGWLACLVSLFAVVWLIASTGEPQQQVLNLFHTFVPLTLFIGAGGLAIALRAMRHEGWTDRVEGLASLSLLALAWGHYGSRTAIRRAAQLAGYQDAVQFESSPYRVVSGLLLVGSALLVVRWLTRQQFGEWAWAAIALAWTSVVVLAGHHIQMALVWAYTVGR